MDSGGADAGLFDYITFNPLKNHDMLNRLLLPSLLFIIIVLTLACRTLKTTAAGQYESYPVYTGSDLGVTYSARHTWFKLWAPSASAARLHLYSQNESPDPERTVRLARNASGVWETVLNGDQKGKFYTVQVQHQGQWLPETPDPYAKAVGLNGHRGQIVDLATTNPPGWAQDRRPELKNFTDIVLYELHVRDASIAANSGIQHKGKFLGLAETGTRNPDGAATGLDHLKELGITHVHLLPVFDFRSIDEGRTAQQRYNWGYDPENYNALEGTYSTDAADGAVRIREFKQLVQALHAAGIRVVMDVVYNHTGGPNDQSVFNRVEPGYYYRQTAAGDYSNASACGNETASERPMMRQFMLESLRYWVQEYHIDGFRFDLMGIHDIETMNRISAELHAIDPTIFLYGEGWTAGNSPLPDSLRALKVNTWKLDGVAAFSDDMRDAIRGYVFDPKQKGFVSGNPDVKESLQFGIVASVQHRQIHYDRVNYSKAPWAREPYQTITYAACHDNHTLWDRLALSAPAASEADRIRMQKLAGAIILTSQGVPFLHAGMEMLRSKQGVENSFESPDSINQIDWSRKTRYAGVFNYFKGLIRLRKDHPAFRLPTADLIRRHLEFHDTADPNFVAYQLGEYANGDRWHNILVLLNGSGQAQRFNLPPGIWTVVLDDREVNEKGLRSMRAEAVQVPPIAAMVLVQED